MSFVEKFINTAKRLFGSSNERLLKQIQPYVDQINSLEEQTSALSDQQLKEKTEEFKQRLNEGQSLDSLLPEAFAVVREASKRVLNMRHFDVQLIGGVVLHRGLIAEMKTGEGKTLVATLAVYLNALSGKGVHVVTVNDYLAKRDSQQMGRLYGFLGLSTGCITHDLDDKQRQEQYASDITYGTNNEFGFDYLRDNMKFHLSELVQKGFNYAIVDEVDSILIDEARTPLIISGSVEEAVDYYKAVNPLAKQLIQGTDYEKDEKNRQIHLTEAGSEKMEGLLKQAQLLTEGSLYDYNNVALVHYMMQSLKAHTLYQKDSHYIVDRNKVIIIDEFTGRMLEGRRYSDGLHQAIEAKEGVKIQTENRTLASVTFQNYFRMYKKLAGMTGTAATEATEFSDIYKLDVVSIPTNVPGVRKDQDDEVYRNSKEKLKAVVALIEDCHKRKQPVLVGTVSIEKSESISKLLAQHKIPHQVLNARHHEQEARIIADAGAPGAVTVATNMAGRGTDIKLGGNFEMHLQDKIIGIKDAEKIAEIAREMQEKHLEQKKIVEEAGGLYVVGTERHESRRIDNQLRGRAGRQGDPGASKFFVSLDDDLMRIFGSEKLEGMLTKLGMTEDESLEHPWINKAIAKAQQKVEAYNYDVRKQLLKYDDVMNEQRNFIYNQRREIMASENMHEFTGHMYANAVKHMVLKSMPQGSYADQWNSNMLHKETHILLGKELPIKEWMAEEGIAEREIEERINEELQKIITEKTKKYGMPLMQHFERTTLLRILDQEWISHFNRLQNVRQGIHLRSYGQRDPLNEYKTEAFNLFNEMLDRIRDQVVQALCKFEIDNRITEEASLEIEEDGDEIEDQVAEQMGFKKALFSPGSEEDLPFPDDYIARNALCPCGSGRKYKRCHGRVDN